MPCDGGEHLQEKPDVRQLVLDLWKQPTDRDRQVKVGASNFSQPCSVCLARDLLATSTAGEVGPYWLGASLGTAVHNYLETLAGLHRPTWLTEQKLVVGDLPGYGTIKSTTDMYEPDIYTAVDYKTTKRDKLKYIKEAFTHAPDPYEISKITEARYKTVSYLGQVQTYGAALVKAGYRVDWVSLLFVCRDGTGDSDVWAHTVPFDPQVAEDVWGRLERLWAWLQDGHSPDELKSHPQCYTCNHRED